MKTKVLITVDVEPSIAGAFVDPARYKPLIHEPVWGEVAGRSEALGYLIETLARHRLPATFFVEAAHTCYFDEQIMGNYARRLADAGHDVALHLHPAWLTFKAGQRDSGRPISDQCSDLDDDRLVRLMDEGRACIESWTGIAPACFRSGNFSVSRAIYRAMHKAGLRTSSNICVGVAPPADASLRFPGGVHSIEGITELPVTCFVDHGPVGRGRSRPMQITACRFEEQRAILTALHAAGGSVAVIVTHPFEFLKWSGCAFSGLRPNRLVQQRFERLCAHLADNADRFDVIPMRWIADHGTAPEPAIALDGKPFSSLFRAVENFVNDRIPM